MRGTRLVACLCMAMLLTSPLFVMRNQAMEEGKVESKGSAEWNTIKGYLKEKGTNNPILGAYFAVQSIYSEKTINYTQEDSSGYYELRVADGQYMAFAFDGRYMFVFTSIVTAGKIAKWQNFTLQPAPPRTSTVKGYVNDSFTGLPLKNLDVFMGEPAQNVPEYANISTTDASGYYEMRLIPGYYGSFIPRAQGYYPNETLFSISDGETLWVNISLDPITSKGTIKGYVNETGGSAIPGAMVVAQNSGQYANSSLTDTLGYYEFDMATGTLNVMATAFRHAQNQSQVNLNPGETLWLNFTLDILIQNAIIRGNITDNATGLPITAAFVSLQNSTYQNMTVSNLTGFYEFYAAGGAYQLFAMKQGYFLYIGQVTLVDGTVVWQDISLIPAPPENCTVQGYITDGLTTNPISNAQVQVSDNVQWFNQTNTDAQGYFKMNTIPGHLTMRSAMPGYYDNSTWFDIAGGEVKWLNMSIYPILPQNVTIKGYVNDSVSGMPISGANVKVSGYANQENKTNTGPSGYYEMMVYPAPQNIFVTANQHAPNGTNFYFTEGVHWLNFTLEPDFTPPALSTMTIMPSTNVSVNNPTRVNGTLVEKYLKQNLVYFAEYHNGTGDKRNYTARICYSSVEWPDAFPVPTRMMSLVPKPGYEYEWNFTWDATTDAGMLGNASGREYVGILYFFWSQDPVIFGFYTNATSPAPKFAIAYFDLNNGSFKMAIVEPGSPGEKQVTAQSDPTGMFGAGSLVWFVNVSMKSVLGANILQGEMYPIVDINISYRSDVLSGEYCVIEQASDLGNNNNLIVDLITVDNDPPVAEAGNNITTFTGRLVHFNGSGSADNIGITNYTWTFFDSSNKTLYGDKPNYTFNTAGIYNVTIKVTDGANNSDTDTMSVNITLPPGHISGKVISGGKNLSGASVKAYLAGTGTLANDTTTGTDGMYNITGLVEGQMYDVNVSATGYYPAQQNNIQANASGVDFDLQKIPVPIPGYICGKVTSGGSNVSGATVKAYLAGTSTLVQQVTTATDGTYNLTGLESGKKYDLNVSASGYVSANRSNVQANASAVNFDLTKITYPGYISGKVTSGGSPVSGASVKAYLAGTSTLARETTTATDGTYNLTGLVAGEKYDLKVSASGYVSAQKSNVQANATGVNFDLTKIEQPPPPPGLDMLLVGGVVAAIVIIIVLLVAALFMKKKPKAPVKREEDREEEVEEEAEKPAEVAEVKEEAPAEEKKKIVEKEEYILPPEDEETEGKEK